LLGAPPDRLLAASAAGSSAITFEVIRDGDGFRALATDWHRLAMAGACQVFQRFDWQWNAWTRVAQPRGRRLHILVGHSGGRVVLIWPLVRDGDALSFLSSEQTEYHDVLVESGPWAQQWLDDAWRMLAATPGGNSLILSDVRADSLLAGLVARQSGAAWRTERQTWLIDLARWGSWDAFSARLSKQMRLDQKRRWKRANELPGGIRFEIVRDPSEIVCTLDWFFVQKLSWMRYKGISARRFGTPEYRGFIAAVTADARARGGLMVARIMTGETIVSASFGYAHDNRFVAHASAYDPAFHAYSPSRLLRERVLQWCFDQGFASFDFLPGDMAYKADWADTTLAVSDYLVPISSYGRLKLRWHTRVVPKLAGTDGLRGLVKKFPPSLVAGLRRRFLADLDYSAPMKSIARS